MQEINLYDLLRYYGRNWLNLLSALLVGAIIGVVYTAFIQTPLYKSDATLLVVGARSSATDSTINNNYTELFKSRLVLGSTIEKQGYSGNYEQLLARTTATNDKNTDVIKVSIADTDPVKSQQLLSESVDTFKRQASTIYGSNNIKTVDTATLTYTAYNVKPLQQIALAMAAVFFLAVIVLFFIYDYTTSYKADSGAATKGSKKGTTKKPVAKKATTKASVPIKQQRSSSYVSSLLRRLSVMFAGDVKEPTVKK